MRFKIPCGKTLVDIDIPADALVTSEPPVETPPVADPLSAVASALSNPIASAPLVEVARRRKSAVIVISDITRAVPNKLILPGILQALESAGLPDETITILIGTGLHREATSQEVVALVGENIASRYRVA